MPRLTTHRILACIMPTIIAFISLYWFRRRRKIKDVESLSDVCTQDETISEYISSTGTQAIPQHSQSNDIDCLHYTNDLNCKINDQCVKEIHVGCEVYADLKSNIPLQGNNQQCSNESACLPNEIVDVEIEVMEKGCVQFQSVLEESDIKCDVGTAGNDVCDAEHSLHVNENNSASGITENITLTDVISVQVDEHVTSDSRNDTFCVNEDETSEYRYQVVDTNRANDNYKNLISDISPVGEVKIPDLVPLANVHSVDNTDLLSKVHSKQGDISNINFDNDSPVSLQISDCDIPSSAGTSSISLTDICMSPINSGESTSKIQDCTPEEDSFSIDSGKGSTLELTSSSLPGDVDSQSGLHRLENECDSVPLGDLGDDFYKAGTSSSPARDLNGECDSEASSASPPTEASSDVLHNEGSSSTNNANSVHFHDTTTRTILPNHYVYEFELPQELCGRLIGRQGKFVKYIKECSNASVYIKRHPFNPHLKLAVIEGERRDVQCALELIRKKYPPSQYPAVTLTQTNVSLSNLSVPLPESLQLHLPDGASADVILSSMVSAGHFFLQQPTHPTYPSLSTLDQCMMICYSQEDTPHLPLPIEATVICAATVMGGWYRAQVMFVHENGEDCDVKFVDYGGYSQVQAQSLRQIRSDFMTLPFQASECYLANVEPTSAEIGWTAEASATFEELAQGQILQAMVVDYHEDGHPYVHLYRVQGITSTFINRELVDRGFAKWIEHH